MEKNIKKLFEDYAIILFGAAVFALSFNLFIKDTEIALGGVTGISMIIHRLFPRATMGFLTLVINIPFLALGLVKSGGKFMMKTVFASVAISLFLEITDPFARLSDDVLLCAVFGGIGIGLGVGLVLSREGSTGGTDIAAWVLRERFKNISVGKLILFVDAAIVLSSALIFRNPQSALYAIINMYAATVAIDGVVYGFVSDRLAYIITKREDEVKSIITEKINHGATVLSGYGAYTDEKTTVFLCAFYPGRLSRLKELVRKADPEAFIIVTNTHEVLGTGFRSKKD